MVNPVVEYYMNGRVLVKVGDITGEASGAIVNAANKTLLGGGGVDGAIHRIGGQEILEECRRIRKNQFPEGLPVGGAVITNGGNLRSKYVIHTVGPVYGQEDGNEPDLLARCYQNSLSLAEEYRISTVSFPSISTGAFGFPKPEAARVVSTSLKSFLEFDKSFVRIGLIFYDDNDAEEFLKHQRF